MMTIVGMTHTLLDAHEVHLEEAGRGSMGAVVVEVGLRTPGLSGIRI